MGHAASDDPGRTSPRESSGAASDPIRAARRASSAPAGDRLQCLLLPLDHGARPARGRRHRAHHPVAHPLHALVRLRPLGPAQPAPPTTPRSACHRQSHLRHPAVVRRPQCRADRREHGHHPRHRGPLVARPARQLRDRRRGRRDHPVDGRRTALRPRHPQRRTLLLPRRRGAVHHPGQPDGVDRHGHAGLRRQRRGHGLPAAGRDGAGGRQHLHPDRARRRLLDAAASLDLASHL
ncbi:hypothetical protein [Ornithinimicrobium kibberense]|uniref:hypothetical protein n=1 Tax=Ornithinimicrobium kibberense TaxID=282060 RepID=UPI003617DFD3